MKHQHKTTEFDRAWFVVDLNWLASDLMDVVLPREQGAILILKLLIVKGSLMGWLIWVRPGRVGGTRVKTWNRRLLWEDYAIWGECQHLCKSPKTGRLNAPLSSQPDPPTARGPQPFFTTADFPAPSFLLYLIRVLELSIIHLKRSPRSAQSYHHVYIITTRNERMHGLGELPRKCA